MTRSISTKTGDAGTTGLLFGGRVAKSSARIACNGAVDEAQASLGLARAQLNQQDRAGGSVRELAELLVSIERDLWVLMAEVATAPGNRRKLVGGSSLVTAAMVDAIEERVHDLEATTAPPAEFVVPGEDVASATLDVARTVIRRAERLAVGAHIGDDSLVVPYLNRLSDLVWLLARSVEATHRSARTTPRRRAKHGDDDLRSGAGPGADVAQ